MLKRIICTHCNKEHEVEVTNSSRPTDEFGFAENSKGSFIAHTIKEKRVIKKNELLTKLIGKYPEEDSTGRLNRVLYDLSKGKYISVSAGVVTYIKENQMKQQAAPKGVKIPVPAVKK
jgi:hypothetical protein